MHEDDAEMDDVGAGMNRLMSLAAKVLDESPDPRTFLDWIAQAGPIVAAAFAAQIDPRTGPVGDAFGSVGVHIYNAMPVAANRFRPFKLPPPGRNDRCVCGSGRKYKHCCQGLSGVLDLSGMNLLKYTLDILPQKRFPEVAKAHADPDAVADTARQWMDEERVERAVALLQPWFAPENKLTAAYEPLFDALCDCYFDLDNDRKRQRLVDDVVARGDAVMRSVALQRRTTMEADRGDMTAAWASFRQAQRSDPDNPALSALEITLHVQSGDYDQARARARFWAARFERSADPALARMVEFMREVERDPRRALAGFDHTQHPGLAVLSELLARAPAVSRHYTLDQHGDNGATVRPLAELGAAEAAWRAAYTADKPLLTETQLVSDAMWDTAAAWLAVLDEQPLAWQSFAVLDDLVLAVDALDTLAVGDDLLDSLLERAASLFACNVSDVAPQAEFHWLFLDNRPALRLLAQRLYRMEEEFGFSDDYIAAAAQLLALNPHDNHGIRESLCMAFVESEAWDRVLALSDRYPDDLASLYLNRLLALLRLGRTDEAFALLRARGTHYRLAIEMLLPRKKAVPRAAYSDFGVTQEGLAYNYREHARPLWEHDGALDWLRKAWREVR